MNKKHNVRRVGTITAGLSMITFGVLFILNTFFNIIDYNTIIKLWPFIILALGCEILISNFLYEKFVYDKGSVFIMFLTALFAMCMAAADWSMLNLHETFLHL